MNIATFIASEYIFDYNGKEYKLVQEKMGRALLYDNFSGKLLIESHADIIYGPNFLGGFHEAIFVARSIDRLKTKKL
jgi:hypothetical protein